jgi:hypothetical protein
MTRQWSRRWGAAATATALLVIGLPAVAADAATTTAKVTSGSAHGYGQRPAPVDASGRSATKSAPHTAAPASRPNVPNELLAKTLFDDDAKAPEPAVSALCQSYVGQPNPYPAVAPNVDAIHDDTTVTVGSQTGCQAAQNETSIATNPYNPRNLVAGSNDYRLFNTRESRNDGSGWAYTTFDGGRTWLNVQLPHLTFQTGATGALSDMDSAGDPAVAFGPHNTVYYANIAFSRFNGGSAVTLSTSHDGGLTWGDPAIIALDGVDANGNPLDTPNFNDKEWVGADPLTGTVYVSWTQFNDTESPIMVRRSTDYGRTFSPAVQVSPNTTNFAGGITSYSSGSIPQVGNDGTLYIAYEAAVCDTLNCDSPNDHDAIVVATSHNHGQTFKNTEVALDFDFPTNEDVGRATLTGLNFRINSFPQMAYDRLTGKLWVTWADDRNGSYDGYTSIKTNGDNFVVSSQNGQHWSGITTVGTSADEVYPAIAAVGGRVAVTSYTRAYDPTGTDLDYAMWTGWGSSLGAIQRVTTVSEDPNVQFVGIGLESGDILQGEFIGDYTAVAMGPDFKVHPCWTDFRGNPGVNTPNQDVYTQSLSAF